MVEASLLLVIADGGQAEAEGAFTLRHELRPAVWEVTVGVSNTVEMHGVSIAAEGAIKRKGVTLPRHALHEETFEVEVRVGALDLSFWNEASAYNSIGISSFRVKRPDDHLPAWS